MFPATLQQVLVLVVFVIIVDNVLDLLVVMLLDKAAQKPMYVFGGCGLFSLGLSLFTFGYMRWLKFAEGISFIQTPVPLIVVMTFMIAMMCVLLGLMAEMITRTFYESQGKAVYGIRSLRNFTEPQVRLVAEAGAAAAASLRSARDVQVR